MQKRGDNLIIKKREIQYKYIGLQMLYQRLPNEHMMKTVIHSKMQSAKAGIIGESKVEGVFDKYQFPFNYCVLHDVSLISNGKFQIDTVFISPYFIVILECKNIIGELSFETEPACLIRTLQNGQIDTYESPEVQVKRNMYLLKEWMNLQGVDIPIKGVIVFNSTKSKVVKPPDHMDIIYASSIPVYLRNLIKEREYLSVTKMKELVEIILQNQQTYFPYPMCKNWGINPADLVTGVKCVRCDRFGMEKLKIGWYCHSCGNTDKEAHVGAIQDWFVLVNNCLTNRECRKFLHINSSQTALRVMETMKLIKFGDNNNTFYKWDWFKKT